MSSVLLTGGSHSEIPLIEAIHKLGYKVITIGNNSDGLGHKQADLYINGDFSDKQFVLSVARDNSVDGIVSGCNDFAYLSTAYACEQLGLAGHDSFETSQIIHHKDLFRNALRKCGLPSPGNVILSSYDDLPVADNEIGYPLLVKPIDLTGGKGVQICNNYQELKESYQNAIKVTRESYVIAEQLIQGENHGVSVFIKNREVVFAFYDNEEYYLNKYLVSGANSPSDISESVKCNIKNQIHILASSLNLVDGLFHCQCIVDKAGTAFLIDPCRRAPGDLYLKLVEYSTGVKYSEAIVQSELGIDFGDSLKGFSIPRCVARECVMTDKNGKIESIEIDDSIKKYIIDKLVWGKRDDIVENYLKYKAGIVFFEYPDEKTMKSELTDLYNKMRIHFVE